MNKIYTKNGDFGKTSLGSGEKVYKFDQQVSTYGDIDELNSNIGLLNSYISNDIINDFLKEIQINLFRVQTILSTKKYNNLNIEIKSDLIENIEQNIDYMVNDMEELKNFILPGGSIESSYSHVCRTICRRSERNLLKFLKDSDLISNNKIKEPFDNIVIFLNRLSDYFFTLARYLNYLKNIDDIKINSEILNNR